LGAIYGIEIDLVNFYNSELLVIKFKIGFHDFAAAKILFFIIRFGRASMDKYLLINNKYNFLEMDNADEID
jgi:hypothetical protein